MMCRMKAPDDMINDTVSVGDGSVYCIPPSGIINVDRADVRDMIALGFWPYRDMEEQFDQGNLGGGGGVLDPGDLTVYFDNQLI
jgi:hypothetical protein